MEDIEISIFNFNDKTIERISLDNLLKQDIIPNQTKKLLGLKGIRVGEIGFGVSDKRKFLSFLFNSIFPGYEIINTEGMYGGHPDYIVKKEDKEIFIEIKWENDTIRSSQIEWMWKNKEKEIRIIWIISFNKSWVFRLDDGSNSL